MYKNIFLLISISCTTFSLPLHWEYKESDVVQLIETGICKECSLYKADLRGIIAYLKKHNFPIILSGSELSEADLEGADLSGAQLDNTILNGAKLRGANLSGANLTNADLRFATLIRVNAQGAHMDNVSLFGALTSGANFTESTLKYQWWYRLCGLAILP
jgi:uncharacterized protein YjbI with pentapeptide repeats